MNVLYSYYQHVSAIRLAIFIVSRIQI